MYFNTDNRMHSVLQYSAMEVGPCEHDKSGALLCGRPARAQFGPPWCLGGIGAPLVGGTKLVTEKHLQVKLETENTSGSRVGVAQAKRVTCSHLSRTGRHAIGSRA